MAANNSEVWQTGRVVESAAVAEGVRRIVLEVPLPRRADPGTHIDVRVRIGGKPEVRSYSVVSASADGALLTVSVQRAAQSRGGSVFMHGLRAGDSLEMTAPMQNFPLRIGAERYVLLAGGIGITAIMNMAALLREVGADYTLVFAGRSRAVMAYLPELQKLHGGRLRVHVDGEGTGLDVPALVSSVTAGTELYMCGPIRLMDAVRRSWQAQGHPTPNLRYETFGNSGWFVPEEFIVRIPRLGIEAAVGAGTSMLEALEQTGVELMSDCRKGECGLCEVKVLALEGRLDHRDVFFSEGQHREGNRMCCCVSRAVARTAAGPGSGAGAGTAAPSGTAAAGTTAAAGAAGPAVLTIEV